jgi:short-subunit dehydrogenase
VSVVRAGLAGLERNRAVVVPGITNKIISQTHRLFPRAFMRRAARMR